MQASGPWRCAAIVAQMCQRSGWLPKGCGVHVVLPPRPYGMPWYWSVGAGGAGTRLSGHAGRSARPLRTARGCSVLRYSLRGCARFLMRFVWLVRLCDLPARA
eukprot:175111-Alexandrium_andersonii.AAC.1